MNSNLKTALIAMAATMGTMAAYKGLVGGKDVILNEARSGQNKSLVNFADMPVAAPADFTYSASVSLPTVVHIKSKSTAQVSRGGGIFDLFGGGFDDDFFGGPKTQQQESSGSGVIISSDGYIVTNNHVIEGSEELEVITEGKKSYKATIIGADPSTDIAVIKIEETKLPAMVFTNSDDAKVGEWVLAVGNPFNLENTVTAGIISAIGRNIDILSSKNRKPQKETPIESFIQTDAAVNPGNSGGALVNLQGQLVGINTAIASPNGAYAGYAFAVPSSIVKKVSTDLIKFGNVQRGYIGLVPVGLDSKKAKELDSDVEEGIYVFEVPEEGAAKNAGVKKGDVILKVDGVETKSEPKFRELIGRKRPGDKAILTINRNGSIKDYTVVLKNKTGGEGVVKKDPEISSAFGKLGIELEEISEKDKQKMGIRNGVRISDIDQNGAIGSRTNFEPGFIITRVGNTRVNSIKEVKAAIKAAEGEEGIMICGTYEDRTNRNYCTAIDFNN